MNKLASKQPFGLERKTCVRHFEVDKDPWLAVNLSMFFPGIGQLYAEKPLKGMGFLILQLVLVVMTIWELFSPSGNTIAGIVCLGIATLVYFINIFDAHWSVYDERRDKILEKIPRKRKNPWFAVFASRVLPGLGHLYLQKSVIGLFLLATTLIFLKLDDIFSSLLIVTPTLGAIASYHTYITFPRRQPRLGRSLVAMMAGLIFLIGIVSNYLPQWIDRHLEMFHIPSESMIPTLQVGDRLFVWQSGNYVPQRGDIIVFTPSENLKQLDPNVSEYYIKRIVATPGDVVSINQGSVYINGQARQEPYIAAPPQYDLPSQVIPANAYFVLGDNRNASFDSHLWGLLPKQSIVGKAFKIYWPPERIHSLE